MLKTKKLSLTAFTVIGMITMTSFPVMAGEWKQNDIGKWWQEDDGTYPSNSWEWIDSDGDSVGECYYFDEEGYLMTGAETPDGYTVNSDGAWTEDNVVQSRNMTDGTDMAKADSTSDGGESSGSWGSSEITVTVDAFMDHMYVLDEPRTRAYLFVGEDKALLVDTLMADDHVEDIVRSVTDLPIEVVITHGHPDHIGGIEAFDSCYINENDASMLPEGITVNVIREGSEIVCGDFCFEIIEIPGHTDGSIALLDRAHGILISGDSVQSGPVIMTGENVSMQAYADSMKKLLDYADDVVYIFAGHHDYPSSRDYIQYAYEDALAYLNGELTGSPITMMGAESMLYQGAHVSFLLDQ
ncbi:MAG: MBL fold metallo-hydrolase [Clostridiales bacterium]|nr:MBL fold metallo-hydrolase [Clostridiales bacterium]